MIRPSIWRAGSRAGRLRSRASRSGRQRIRPGCACGRCRRDRGTLSTPSPDIPLDARLTRRVSVACTTPFVISHDDAARSRGTRHHERARLSADRIRDCRRNCQRDWGEPRATIAVDVTVSVDEERLPATVPALPRASGLRSQILSPSCSRHACCRWTPMTVSGST